MELVVEYEEGELETAIRLLSTMAAKEGVSGKIVFAIGIVDGPEDKELTEIAHVDIAKAAEILNKIEALSGHVKPH